MSEISLFILSVEHGIPKLVPKLPANQFVRGRYAVLYHALFG